MARALAIDYGEKRIGLAVTDPLRMFAQPLETIASETFPDWLSKYQIENEVDTFIVGMPRRLSGEETHVTQRVIEFISWLKKSYPTQEIVTIDERYSSKEAQHHISQMGMKKKQREQKGILDRVSAALILQTYLEQSL
jgi:putative Holliday junction resolvase